MIDQRSNIDQSIYVAITITKHPANKRLLALLGRKPRPNIANKWLWLHVGLERKKENWKFAFHHNLFQMASQFKSIQY